MKKKELLNLEYVLVSYSVHPVLLRQKKQRKFVSRIKITKIIRKPFFQMTQKVTKQLIYSLFTVSTCKFMLSKTLRSIISERSFLLSKQSLSIFVVTTRLLITQITPTHVGSFVFSNKGTKGITICMYSIQSLTEGWPNSVFFSFEVHYYEGSLQLQLSFHTIVLFRQVYKDRSVHKVCVCFPYVRSS